MRKLLLLFISIGSLAAAEPVAGLDKRLADLEKAAKSAQSPPAITRGCSPALRWY